MTHKFREVGGVWYSDVVVERVYGGDVHSSRGEKTGDEIHVAWRVASRGNIVVKSNLGNYLVWGMISVVSTPQREYKMTYPVSPQANFPMVLHQGH